MLMHSQTRGCKNRWKLKCKAAHWTGDPPALKYSDCVIAKKSALEFNLGEEEKEGSFDFQIHYSEINSSGLAGATKILARHKQIAT